MPTKKNPDAPVVEEEKSVKKTPAKTAKKTAPKAETKTAPKTEAKAETKTETKTETKAPAKTAKKAPAKTEPKTETKAAPKAKTVNEKAFLQYNGRELDLAEVKAKAAEAFKAEKGARAAIRDIVLYIKPEENKVYFVVNDSVSGSVEF